jgi:hypothetical protein
VFEKNLRARKLLESNKRYFRLLFGCYANAPSKELILEGMTLSIQIGTEKPLNGFCIQKLGI